MKTRPSKKLSMTLLGYALQVLFAGLAVRYPKEMYVFATLGGVTGISNAVYNWTQGKVDIAKTLAESGTPVVAPKP